MEMSPLVGISRPDWVQALEEAPDEMLYLTLEVFAVVTSVAVLRTGSVHRDQVAVVQVIYQV